MKDTRKAMFKTFLSGGLTLFLFFVFVSWAAAQVCVQPPSGLVGWWPGDGNADDIFSNNHGTLAGDTDFVQGMVDHAFYFDGDYDWVRVEHHASLDLNHFTLEVWVKPDSYAPLWQALISKGALPRPPSLWLFLNKVQTWVDLPYNRAQATSISGLNNNEWVHLATTYDGSSVKIYINGVLDVSSLNSGNTPPANELPYLFGARNYPPQNPDSRWIFKGLMDEISIYNRALSEAEIQAIFNAGSAGKCKIIDEDGDGVNDDVDLCPGTVSGEAVDISGCSIAQICPPDDDYKNHGQYTSCVSNEAEIFLEGGLITEDEKNTIVSGAAKSGAGKKNKKKDDSGDPGGGV